MSQEQYNNAVSELAKIKNISTDEAAHIIIAAVKSFVEGR